MLIPDINELNAVNCRKITFSKLWPEFYEYLQNKYPQYSLSEQLALYYNNLIEPPKCVVCGGNVKFINFKSGWRRTCCKKCSGRDSQTKLKRQQTCIEKYGVDNAAKSDIIKDKSKQTCLKRYGISNAGWTEESQKKIKNTNKERYGVDWGTQNDIIKNKIKNTCLERYGVDWNSKIDSVKESKSSIIRTKVDDIKYNILHNTMNSHDDIINITDDFMYVCKCPHPGCDKCANKIYNITPKSYHSRHSCEKCTILNPEGISSNKDTYIELFVKDILKESFISYEDTPNNNILYNKQHIDIYCPDLNIGFECNGVYWHSSKYKTPNYHVNKTKAALESGIRLYHIWEDWVVKKPDILKSMILNWVGKSKYRIYARNCEIKEVDKKIGFDFLDKNHIQGHSNYKVGYGLYYNNELVSLMTFGKKRGCVGRYINNNESEWELIRFCSKLNTNIVGGASKLLRYFIKNMSPKIIYSYSSCDISNGDLYKKLGFESDNKIKNSYWYIDKKTFQRYHRTSFTKDSIVRRGWMPDKNGWTEKEVMLSKGYYCIYDSGQLKWVLSIK